MIDDVATYLAANTNLRKGVTLFSGNAPDSPVDCVVIFDTGGSPPEQEFPADHPTIQVMCRGQKNRYSDTMARAQEIFNLLNRKLNLTIGTKNVMQSKAIASPQSLGLDEKMRWQIVTNFIFYIRVT